MISALKNISTDLMLAEIKRRNRLVKKLNVQRAHLLQRISSVEAAIKAEGGEIKSAAMMARSAKRPRNAAPLVEMLAKVMHKEKSMSVNQIAEAVTLAGYRSTSSTFKTIIFQTLGKDKRFKKVSRGQYIVR